MRHFDAICEFALDHHGLVTVADAGRLGVHRKELLRWVESGRLERRWRGVYRLVHFVPSTLALYAEAVAAVGADAMVFGESVLAMHDLALVNPPCVHIARSVRHRRKIPGWIHVVPRPAGTVEEPFDGIPCQNLPGAFRACKGIVMPDRLAQGVLDAERKGLLGLADADALKKEFPA